MEVIVTIGVRNPDWYWTKEHLKEVGKEGRKGWELINKDKIEKHLPSVCFGFKYDVKSIDENREAEFQFELNGNVENVYLRPIKDLTVVNYKDDNNVYKRVIISNSLIHQYVGAKKRGYKYYTYFYLKENVPFVQVAHNVWLSEEHDLELQKQIATLNTKV